MQKIVDSMTKSKTNVERKGGGQYDQGKDRKIQTQTVKGRHLRCLSVKDLKCVSSLYTRHWGVLCHGV